MPSLFPIPAFQDNYIWALHDASGSCVVVDPGDARPVEAFLQRNQLRLAGILITHHHPDHVGGIAALLEQRQIPVLGPAKEAIPHLSQPLHDGDQVDISGLAIKAQVIEVPGHTNGHIAYFCPQLTPATLFCGDTLFAAGCGRLFEGTPADMLTSLDRLARLPAATRVCCAHEYTLANLAFARAVTPDDPRIKARIDSVQQQRDADLPSLPTTLAEELATNPFLRVDDAALIAALSARGEASDRVQRFALLRQWKDGFRP